MAGNYEKIDFIDDISQEAIGEMDSFERLYGEYDSVFVGIGNNQLLGELIHKLEEIGYEIPVFIHPTAYASKSAMIGKGTVVEPKRYREHQYMCWGEVYYLGRRNCESRCRS